LCIDFGIIKSNTMPAPVLILITGAPCTGKTTIAQHLAGKFQLPVVHKDDIKERLFDRLDYSRVTTALAGVWVQSLKEVAQ
jgi:predicted kinase